MYTIKEVSGKSMLRKFIKFQDDLYKDCEQYIPLLKQDEIEISGGKIRRKGGQK